MCFAQLLCCSLQVELDMPNRTTRDYEGPQVAPKIQAALDAALQDEDDSDIEK
jgi:kinesin family protein 3/17